MNMDEETMAKLAEVARKQGCIGFDTDATRRTIRQVLDFLRLHLV